MANIILTDKIKDHCAQFIKDFELKDGEIMEIEGMGYKVTIEKIKKRRTKWNI